MRTDTVASVKDPLVQQARDLASRAGRRRHGRLLVEGTTLVRHVLESGSPVDAILIRAGEESGTPLDATADAAGVDIHPVRAGVLRHVLGTAAPPDCLAIAPYPAEIHDQGPAGPLAVVCDRVVDPGNLGSIFRTACGLGAGMILTGDEDVTARKVVDASRGAVLRRPVHRFAGPLAAVRALQAQGFLVVATVATGGVDVEAIEPDGRPVALVVGNETAGLDGATAAAADVAASICLQGDVESLNVAVAAGIGLYVLGHRPPA